jgi:hypothetical protein
MDDRPNGSVVCLPTPRPRFGEVMPLLRARRERPRRRRAGKQRDELVVREEAGFRPIWAVRVDRA